LVKIRHVKKNRIAYTGEGLKIASFNANGIRARMPLLLKWLAQNRPDVLCIQETKVQDVDFPIQPLADAGYFCAFKGEKSYNGVALLSRMEPHRIRMGFDAADGPEGTRLIAARFGGLQVVNTYIPQGRDPASEKFRYKLDWFRRLKHYFEEHFDPGDLLLWAGDFNVAPAAADVYDPVRLAGHVGFHPAEHEALAGVMQWGFVDLYRHRHPDEKAYTFWDYRLPNAVTRGLGWRIDHLCGTLPLAERLADIWIDVAARRAPRPSDHTFIVAEFDLP